MKQSESSPNGQNERLKVTLTEPLWTVTDVAVYLRLKPETVRIMARAKKLPALKIGKVWRFKANEIKAMLNPQPAKGGGLTASTQPAVR